MLTCNKKIVIIFCIVLGVISFVYFRKPKSIETFNKETDKVIVCGETAGIKLLASGVLVMGFENVETEEGIYFPAEGVDLKIGDIILEVNDSKVETNDQLMQKTKESNGLKMKLKVLRNGKEHITYIAPVKSKLSHEYKLGLWVKDSSAGVGTITFVDRKNNSFAALGHGITETKDNYILPILTGGLVKTQILGINKGIKGKPGDLKGTLTNMQVAEINLNTEYGIYGKMIDLNYIDCSEEMEILKKEKIKTGKAYIYATIDGDKKEKFEVEIEKVLLNSSSNKNLVIKITDERLLEKTGGIVQGMSGSPIIQNGKLVGAITHVFLNEPKKGYGVFAENMISDLNKIN